MTPEWFKLKKYPHIGLPLTKKDKGWAIAYVKDIERVKKHKFTPFLHRTIKQRKFRPEQKDPKNKYGKRIRVVKDPKEREIFYASHLDSILYSYYSYLLTDAYEKHLLNKPYNLSAVAYRKIPKLPGKKGNKSNIEFAKEAFDFIERNKNQNLTIIIADVTAFFDNLDHKILHSKWKEVLGKKDSLGRLNLPDDHYNVYKSLTNKRFVNENELFDRFKNTLWAERGLPNDSSTTEIKQVKVKKRRYLKKENVVAYCTKNELFQNHIDLIRSEKACSLQHHRCRKKCNIKGIPQGSPMSATLANIYMLDFDALLYEEVAKKGGFYQRYSDDLIIVCNQKDEVFFINEMAKAIEDKVKLKIQPNKTNIYRYENKSGIFEGGIVDQNTNTINPNYQLEYLGFKYTGSKVYVKTVGFSKFYRSMRRSIKRGAHFASKPSNKKDNLFKERLIKRFTVKGSNRRLIWKEDPKRPGEYFRSEQQYWGNYFSYINKANEVMKTINGDDTIKKQSNKIWVKFHKQIKTAEVKIARKRKKGNN